MLTTPFYNPAKSYQDNYDNGPFGAFADSSDSSEVTARDPRTVAPEHSFLGFPVHLPFGIPAGPLINGNFVKAALDKGFDIAVYKTVRTRKYPCHPLPNVLSIHISGDLTIKKAQTPLEADTNYSKPISITNSFGVPSKPPDQWQPDLKSAVNYAKNGQVVVGSFQGTTGGGEKQYLADHILGARLVKETGCKVIEVNLSCPNEGTGNLLCFNIDTVKQIAEAIKNEIGNTPLTLKLAYFQPQHNLEKFVKLLGNTVQGFSAINTIPAEIINKQGKHALPGKGRERSGVCGAAIKWAGLDMVKRLKKLRQKYNMKFAIVGVGGVTTPQDYHQYRKAGADAVMSATGAIWNPLLALAIKSSL